MKVYIAGPMSGIPKHNFPAFFAAESFLLEHGLEGEDCYVVNPAHLNAHLGMDQEWHVYLRNDIKSLVDCDAIYMLLGWESSRGAALELDIAKRLGMKIYFQPETAL